MIQLTEWAWLQVMLCMYLNQAYTMFTAYNRIYEEKQTHLITNINEIIILLTIYHLFCFTNFVPDAETRASFVGISMVSVTFVIMIVNLSPIVFNTLKMIKRKLQNAYAKINAKIKKFKRKQELKRRREK